MSRRGTQHVVGPFRAEVESHSQAGTEATISRFGSNSKRTRGPNRLKGLSNQQRQVVLYNEYGQPVGDIERQLASYIGILARDGQLAPIDCLDWRKMPDEKKKRMWEVVLTRFDVDPEKGKNWVLAKLATSWRNWKNELKRKYYDPFEY